MSAYLILVVFSQKNYDDPLFYQFYLAFCEKYPYSQLAHFHHFWTKNSHISPFGGKNKKLYESSYVLLNSTGVSLELKTKFVSKSIHPWFPQQPSVDIIYIYLFPVQLFQLDNKFQLETQRQLFTTSQSFYLTTFRNGAPFLQISTTRSSRILYAVR